jgi:5'-deoxynucleotidase YfbR-like HD superfamily hydrolase
MSRAVKPALALEALLHEVGEAVCGDMTAPLKALNPTFKAIEKRCEAAILAKFGVTISNPLEIKKADVRMLATERRDLLPWKGERWSMDDDTQPYSFEIIPWSPDVAARDFLNRYKELTTNG